ncbi:LLM class flavin-dependent oxidoreductase [Novosphingobium jiangmenense]|uniref:LLM class flavin-dependent oxidoreductase n=1 Tax=Novosphingobium jiangmenense TaxID=2791981 RepID=A0ABS0HB07_9SPHN|nr:LLM class flavin-dependent oxidoreductase [Novosphingobium jiangmenense]MBF9149464.1 LLM class flavin-dependent oxidoreductase [Novosphingobium jiangmenense]
MPVEINGLINHNISSEIAPLPFETFDPEGIVRMARLHDAWGYDKVLVANAAVMPDNFTIAATIAAHTTRLGVMLAHRPGFIPPTMAARMLATLDRLMPGRLGVHIITAASDEETQADGDYLTKVERYDRAKEYIEILRAMWTSDAPITHEGKWFRFTGGFAAVKPANRDVPVYFGGMSPAALEVAGQYCDTFATLSDTVAGMTEVVAKVRAVAAPHGRNPDFLCSMRVVLGETEAEAWARADAIRDSVAANMGKLAVNTVAAKADGFKRTAELAARGDRLEKCFWNGINQLRGGQSNSGALVGTPAQVADALMDYYDAGVNKFILRGFDPVDDVIGIGRDLIPLVRAAVAQRDAAR